MGGAAPPTPEGDVFMRNELMEVVISPRDFLRLSMPREMVLRLLQ
jgi:hypothetical protein